MNQSDRRTSRGLPLAARWGVLVCLVCAPSLVFAQAIVPGTGQRSLKASDDFEDAKWSYRFNLPKSSQENNHQERLPTGGSVNGRWYEGVKRGQPDVIERVATPSGGIAGSRGSLLMRSQETGVPGMFSGQNQQDDLIFNVAASERGAIPVSWSPSVVVRVYLPPWDQWERRAGSSFGFRASCFGSGVPSERTGRRRGGGTKSDTYWPGMFIRFVAGDGAKTPDSARLILRAGPQGQDFAGPQITQSGWWTLGMSFSPDGQVHYYAHAGVDDLRAEDHLSSQFHYGARAERLDTYFFNVVSGDNGNWSTPWVIDDPSLYYTRW